MSKNNILLLFISLSSLLSLHAQIITDDNASSSEKVIDEILAQVGDNIILHSDIEAQKLQMENNKEAPGGNQNRCQIIEEQLYQKLLLNQAQIDSIEITDDQVNAEMENRLRTIEQQIGSREKLEEFYGKTYTQIKNEFRDIIRDRMLSQEMERQITKDVTVSPEDVQRFFKNIPEDSVPYINEKIAIQQIVIFPKISQSSKNAVIKKLKKWRQDIIDGDRSFSAVATIHSEDQGSAKKGGKIEATRGMMVKPFEAAAFSLEVGEISNVVETQYGFHIIKLLDRKGDDYTIRHILLSPEVSSEDLSKAAALIDECHARLKQHEITWEEAVKEYSEDDKTRRNQGNLTNPYSGDQYWDVSNINRIDPQIFGLVNNLDEGEISEPALYTDQQSRKEGVRIVRIKNRIDPHVANLDQDYSFIKKAAKNEQKQRIIQDWVTSRVRKTYIRLDDSYDNCDFDYEWK